MDSLDAAVAAPCDVAARAVHNNRIPHATAVQHMPCTILGRCRIQTASASSSQPPSFPHVQPVARPNLTLVVCDPHSFAASGLWRPSTAPPASPAAVTPLFRSVFWSGESGARELTADSPLPWGVRGNGGGISSHALVPAVLSTLSPAFLRGVAGESAGDAESGFV